MSTNHGRLCRDGQVGSLTIKAKTVIDESANLDVNGAVIRGTAKIKGDLEVQGNITGPKHYDVVYTAGARDYDDVDGRITMGFFDQGWPAYAVMPFETEVYAVQASGDEQTDGYAGKLIYEAYTSNSTTPLVSGNLLASEWTTHSDWLDGVGSTFARYETTLIDPPVVVPAGGRLQAILDNTDGFDNTGGEWRVLFFTRSTQ